MNQTATIEIIISYVVLAVIIILLKCIINTKLKLKYGKTGHETLKFETVLLKNLRECTSNFKSGIIDISRLTLLSLVISLPLIGIAIFTNLYVIFALYSLFFKAPLFVRVLPPSLLLVDAVVMQYFLSRYGTVYKLPLILLIRNDTRQSLKEHLHLYMISAIGSMVYVVAIISLLKTFVIAPGLLKIGVGIIVALLVTYVLPNRKNENAINLWKKFTSGG